MNKFLLTIAVFALAFSSKAQNVLADGNKYFAQGKYYEAANCYEKVLGINRASLDKVQGFTPYSHKKFSSKKSLSNATPSFNREEVIYKLAESYRLYTNFEQAQIYYKKLVDSSKANFPLKKYWYAICLRSNKQYSDAQEQFTQFVASYTPEDSYKSSANRELKILKNIALLLNKKDSALYKVVKLESPLNSDGSNTSPSWMPDGSLLFTSSRLDSSDMIGTTETIHPLVQNHIYTTTGSDVPTNPVRVKFANDTFNMNEGATSVTPDGSKVFFTIWKQVQDKKVYVICVADLKNKTWTNPKLVGSTVNVDGYSSKQPFVTSDGKYLLFSSDRPGGLGGFDIWYAELGRDYYVLDAYNLGEPVNTFADEQAPYYHTTTSNLVFASNGRIGMGGLDLYKSKGHIKTGWAEPKNLGAPINSSKDEIDFLSKEDNPLLDKVYFSSDNGDVCCPQLYTLHKDFLGKVFTGQVVDSATNLPLSNAQVTIYDSITGKELYTFNTDNNGQYTLNLKKLNALKIRASKESYYNDNNSYSKMENLEEIDEDNFILPKLSISKIPPVITKIPPPDIVIYFNFDKSDITAIGKHQLDSMIERINADTAMVIEIQGNTDSKGSSEYNKRLGYRRAKACYDYMIGAGVKKERLTLVSYGKEKIVVDDTNDSDPNSEAARQKNRRVEFRIIKQTKKH